MWKGMAHSQRLLSRYQQSTRHTLTTPNGRYKDKDTLDGLLSAFAVLAGDKENLPPEALKANLKPAHATYLETKMSVRHRAIEPSGHRTVGPSGTLTT